MVIYNALLLMCMFNIFLFKKSILFFTLLILGIFCGLREGVLGYDYFVYEEFYNNVLIEGNKFNYEPLFYFLTYSFKYVGFSYHFFIFSISMFFHLSLYFFLLFLRKEMHLNIGLVLCAYVSTVYFWHSYTLVRQSIPIAIFYFSIPLFFKQSKLAIINFIGVGFHIGHVSSLFIQLFGRGVFSYKKLVFILSMTLVFMYYSPLFLNKMEQYESGRQSGIYPVLEFLFIFFVFVLLKNKLHILNFIAMFGAILSLFGFFMGEVFVRFSEPLKIIIPIGLAYIFSIINKNNKDISVVYAITLIVYCFFRLNFFFMNFGEFAVPYRSVFF